MQNKIIKNMDYTNIPRELLYRERKSLEEFYCDNNLNGRLIIKMRQFSEFNTPDADTLIITCLNTAYYICTVAAVADNRGDFNIDNIWAGVREAAFGTVNHDQEKYQKIIFSLVMVLIERSTRNVQILSSLTNKIHKYMHDKYASNSHIEYSIFMHDTNNTILHEDTFEPINIIQALELDSTNIISVVRGFGYIEECIRRINDHGVQKHVLNLALSKFDHQWYHDNEVDSVKWRLESMRDHIKSYSAPKVPPYHDKNIPNQKKKAHEKQHNLFEKTQKFVEDTQYFCSVIKSEQFYDRNGYFYQETKERFDSYCDVNEDEFVKEVNNSPLQTYFDDYKKLLNSIVIPDLDTFSMSKYIQENLTSDRELLEDALEIFETVVEKCGNLRNSVENFMELYDLKDNYPKIGFLRPIFIDEAGQPNCQKNIVVELENSNTQDLPSLWTLEDKNQFQRFELKDINYRKLYELLVAANDGIMTSEITFDYFTDIVQRAQFGKIYQHCDTKKGKIRMVVTYIARHTTNNEKKKEYLETAALSMGFVRADGNPDIEKVGKYNVPTTDKLRMKLEGKA